MPRPLRHLTGVRSRGRGRGAHGRTSRARAAWMGEGGDIARSRGGRRPAPPIRGVVVRLAEATGDRTAGVVGSGFTTGGGRIPTL